MKKKLVIPISSVLIIGFFVTQFFGLVIYDNFSEKKEFRPDRAYGPLTITLQNNNPISIQNFSPMFFVDLKVINSTGKVECYLEYSKETACESNRWDLQKIESGRSNNLQFFVFANQNNFTIQATPYLNIVNFALPLPSSSSSWSCHPINSDYYWCVKNRN